MSTTPVTPPPIRTSARSGLRDSVLGTRNLMTVAALGVVGSLLVVPLTYVSAIVAVSPRGVLVMCALMGAWMVPFLLPGVIVNKPGVFVVAGLVMGVVSAFLTPQGPAAIVSNLLGSVLVGAPIAVLLYRHWTWWAYLLSGAVFGGVNAMLYSTGFRVALTTQETVLGAIASVLSCWVAVGVCLLLRRALERTGLAVSR
ncbi:ECF transporter S component [Actinomyces sp. W5033]|uniref:ECF transporter S component n=1 Tax=Actinomyces sp. W5033 TaxID=3446479 RepID=UPI003EE3EFEB